MKLKDTFMSTYCYEDRNPAFEEHAFDREEYEQLMHEMNPGDSERDGFHLQNNEN